MYDQLGTNSKSSNEKEKSIMQPTNSKNLAFNATKRFSHHWMQIQQEAFQEKLLLQMYRRKSNNLKMASFRCSSNELVFIENLHFHHDKLWTSVHTGCLLPT